MKITILMITFISLNLAASDLSYYLKDEQKIELIYQNAKRNITAIKNDKILKRELEKSIYALEVLKITTQRKYQKLLQKKITEISMSVPRNFQE